MTVNELLGQWEWKPIRNCPGRFILATNDTRMPLEILLGGEHPTQTFTSVSAKDTVIVVELEDGGLISYARKDGSLVHTVNTSSGFARKLSQLGIALSTDSHQSA